MTEKAEVSSQLEGVETDLVNMRHCPFQLEHHYQHFQGKRVGMMRPLIVGCSDWRGMPSWNNGVRQMWGLPSTKLSPLPSLGHQSTPPLLEGLQGV